MGMFKTNRQNLLKNAQRQEDVEERTDARTRQHRQTLSKDRTETNFVGGPHRDKATSDGDGKRVCQDGMGARHM